MVKDIGRRDFLIAFGGLILTMLAGPVHPAGKLSVVDFRGLPLTLAAPARRIVCLIESALSGLYMLGAQNALAGVPANVYAGDVARHYARLDPRLAKRGLPAPGNWDFVSIEAVLVLRPDLVVIWSHQKESIAALERHGIPVYGVFIASAADVRKEIQDLAALTSTEARAHALLAQTEEALARIAAAVKAAGGPLPTVYFAWGQGMLETSCQGSNVDELIRLAGGRNVCNDTAEHATVGLERVLRWNPDVIVLWHSPRRSRRDVLADPQWRNVAAVRTGRVFELPEVFDCDLWTLKFQHAVRLLAGWFHPRAFAGEATGAERDKMMAALYGIPLPR